ncbi:MAG: hypothetical protein PHE25_04725 [Candidatus Gracilibacteria bacterium]|nr:hypothetical protein [Candidatus Gracilibacteria bacterium]
MEQFDINLLVLSGVQHTDFGERTAEVIKEVIGDFQRILYFKRLCHKLDFRAYELLIEEHGNLTSQINSIIEDISTHKNDAEKFKEDLIELEKINRKLKIVNEKLIELLSGSFL